MAHLREKREGFFFPYDIGARGAKQERKNSRNKGKKERELDTKNVLGVEENYVKDQPKPIPKSWGRLVVVRKGSKVRKKNLTEG